MVEAGDVTALVSELVRIDSSNSWLVPGSPGEAVVAAHIARWLERLGVEVTLEEVQPGHPNMVAIWRGTGGGKSLCVSSHLDTVGYAGWKDQALVPYVEGERMIGLGAADDKGHCAVGMLVMRSLIGSGTRLKGDLWVALTVDEEGTSSGTMHFAGRHRPDAVLLLEPSSGLGSVTVTHQGFGWLDIITEGRAAHGSAPDKGIDAVAHMAEVITRLRKLDREKYAATIHPLNGRTVFHTGTISGGTDYATYPDRCTLGIEIGTQVGETIDARVAEIEEIFHDIRRTLPDFRGRVEVRLARNPFEAKGHEKLLSCLAVELERQTGRPARLVGENSWGDSALFQEAGIPTLMLGAAGGNLHAPQEWVSIPELVKLARAVEATARSYCS